MKFISGLVSVLIIPGLAWSNSSRSPARSSEVSQGQERMIYERTLAQCQGNSSWVFNKNTLDAFLISAGQTFHLLTDPKPAELKLYVENRLLSVYVMDRLNSEAFTSALKICFPNQPELQQNFVRAMMISDLVGKLPIVYIGLYISGLMKETFPRTHQVLNYSVVASTATAVILRTRELYLDKRLTAEEKARVNRLKASLDKSSRDQSNAILELAYETRRELQIRLQETQDPEKIADYKNAIAAIDEQINKLIEN